MSEPLFTKKQTANFFGVSERTVERWDVTGEGPGFIRLGRLKRYSPAACRALAASCSFPHRAAELARAPNPEKQTAGL